MSSTVAVSRSPFSLISQVQQHAGEGWLLNVQLPPMTRADAAPWIAFLAKLRGKRGTFYYGSYLQGTIRGLGGGTPLVNGASQSGYTLAVDGCTNSAGFLKEGDFFSIDSSLYMNLTDVSANGSGQCTLDIWPRLRTHADNTALDLTFPKGIFRLTENGVTISETATKTIAIGISAEEAL